MHPVPLVALAALFLHSPAPPGGQSPHNPRGGVAHADVSRPSAAGTITGRVTDKETGAPILGASVTVVGTTLGNNTDEDGRYRITGVPVGLASVTARRIGYGSVTQKITVTE